MILFCSLLSEVNFRFRIVRLFRRYTKPSCDGDGKTRSSERGSGEKKKRQVPREKNNKINICIHWSADWNWIETTSQWDYTKNWIDSVWSSFFLSAVLTSVPLFSFIISFVTFYFVNELLAALWIRDFRRSDLFAILTEHKSCMR